MLKMAITHSETDSLRLEGIHYANSKDTFTIFNVPIAAELVQPYGSEFAYKSREEIMKIKVENIPITMRYDIPSHPPDFLGDMPSDEVGEYVVGFMREPSNPVPTMSDSKRYADFVLFKNDRTSRVIEDFINGELIDTSIGFKYERINQPGRFQNIKYDFLQTNIIMDHNAILMDATGRVATGRMPAPIGGIGADKADAQDQNKVLEARKVSDEYKALKEQLDLMTKERDSALAELKEHKAVLAKDEKDKFQQEIDSLKQQNEKVLDEKKSLQVEFDSMKAKLGVFEKAEKDRVDNMKVELKKAYPDMDELFDGAKDEIIVKHHAKLVEAQKKAASNKGIGADMVGPAGQAVIDDLKSEAERTASWVKPKKAKEE